MLEIHGLKMATADEKLLEDSRNIQNFLGWVGLWALGVVVVWCVSHALLRKVFGNVCDQ